MPPPPDEPSRIPGAAAVYHRLASPSQPDDVAALQEATGEIWGSYNRDMMGGRAPFPSVDAYVGPLPPGARGIEFTTDLPPNPHLPPYRARWTGPREGVIIEGDYAKIRVTVTKNSQRGGE
jgi:hypothetical protein